MSFLRLPTSNRAAAALLPVIGVFAALTLLVAAVGPLATSDGPVHLNFSRFWWYGPSGPLQQQFFTARETLVPNMLIYVIAGPLIPVLGSDATEMVVQLLCLFALPLATLSLKFSNRRSRNLAVVLMAVLSVNQMFFMGLYNYALSLGAALIALSMTMRASARPERSAWAWAGVTVALVAAFFAHAAGLLAGLCFVGAWVAPAVVHDLRSGTRVGAVVGRWAPAALAVVPAVALVLVFAARQPSSPIAYGFNLQGRILQLLRLDIIAVHGVAGRVAASLLSLLVLTLWFEAARRRVRAFGADPASRLDTVRYVLLLAGTLVLAFGFPDVAGGGWTHVRRMMPLPVIAAILIITAGPLPRRRAGFATSGAAVILAVLLIAAYLEQLVIATTVRQSDRLLARVPNGCTILPVVPEQRRTTSIVGPIQYSPFIHVANRAEMRGDRVVLFNYLARLDVYPVSVTSGHEMQTLVFDWKPKERDPRIFKVGIRRFEALSGAHVDYVLLQRHVASQPAGITELLSQFETVASEPEFLLLRRVKTSLKGFGDTPNHAQTLSGKANCSYHERLADRAPGT